jgi:hypothetical protein
MTQERIASFEEFWPFYVREHSKKTTRTLHFVGTTAAMACLAGAVALGRPRLLLALPFAGYGPAWFSHFFVEKNRPASFKYPLWSLLADLRMWSLIARGAMDAEVDRIMAEGPREAPENDNGVGRVVAMAGEDRHVDPQTLN